MQRREGVEGVEEEQRGRVGSFWLGRLDFIKTLNDQEERT